MPPEIKAIAFLQDHNAMFSRNPHPLKPSSARCAAWALKLRGKIKGNKKKCPGKFPKRGTAAVPERPSLLSHSPWRERETV
jgi:hypothetical protein